MVERENYFDGKIWKDEVRRDGETVGREMGRVGVCVRRGVWVLVF